MTLDLTSRLMLEHDEPGVEQFLAEHSGSIVRDDRIGQGGGDPAIYWLTMRPASHSTECYFPRLVWEQYPGAPPSIKFADGIRGSLTVMRAWPVITGYRSTSFDICRPMSREGYDLHPEWRQGTTAWVSDGNPFLWVVMTLQFHLDNEYQGRSQ